MPSDTGSDLLINSTIALNICFALATICAFMTFFIQRQGTLGMLVIYMAIIVILEQHKDQSQSVAPTNETRWLYGAAFINAFIETIITTNADLSGSVPPDWTTYSNWWSTMMLFGTIALWTGVSAKMKWVAYLAAICFAVGYILIMIQYTVITQFKTDG
jgi:hypothetical protein